jgi:tetratricopeptide (TPR) repeat protein
MRKVTNKKGSPQVLRSSVLKQSIVAGALASICLLGLELPSPAFTGSPGSWQDIQNRGTTALDSNEYWKAEPLLKKAIAMARTYGPNDLRLAKSLNEMGRLYTVRGRFAEAEPYLVESLYVTENALGKENAAVIPAMGSLIRFYVLHGSVEQAQPLTEELLNFVEGKLRDPTPQSTGKITLKKGEPLQAYAGTAAPVMRDPLIEWAITCDDLGSIYKTHKDYDLADRLFKAALDLKSSVLGKEHLSLANSYGSLGEICMERNESADAQSYFKDALSTTERVLEPDNPIVYSRLDKLAKCLIKAGKPQEAEELYQRAKTFYKGEQVTRPNEMRCLFALGCLYCDEKKYDSAAPLLQQSLEMAEELNGPSSIGLVPYLQKYAYVLYYLGRRSECDELKARANVIAGVTN